MAKTRDRDIAYRAADRFVEAALKSDGSLFKPNKAIWAPRTIDDLYERFVERPDESSDTFEEKFARQLQNAPPATIQLAGEVLYVHLLTPRNVHGDTKRELIGKVLSWSSNPITLPKDLREALDFGLANVGIAYHTYRPFQLRFLLDFIRSWKTLDTKGQILSNPWSFMEFVDSVPIHKAFMQRHALLHLVHPDTFENIVSREAKQRIANRFNELVDKPTDNVDRQLTQIRRKLTEKYGSGFRFYDPEIARIWQPDTSKWGQFVYWVRRFYERPDFDSLERDYKLEIAANLERAKNSLKNGDADWFSMLERAFGPPNNLTYWTVHDRFLKWCKDNVPDAKAALNALWHSSSDAGERIRGFLKHIPNALIRGVGTRLSLASFLQMGIDATNYPIYKSSPFQKGYELTGFPKPPRGADEGATFDHGLSFLDRLDDEASERGVDLRDRLDAQGVLWSVVKPGSLLESLSAEDQKAFRRFLGEPLPGDDGGDDEPVERVRSDTIQELAGKLLLDGVYLAEVDKLLSSKRQVIFHGPPGTGKTYVARELAKFYAGQTGTVQFVQFHPSYAYEDFVEGYRPSPGKDEAPFKLIPGPLKRLAQKAADNPGAKHILVIDEINRGNLAKVFGELYFLLEYRNEEISLQYSRELFSLPDNLWVIGTMNTADRSIALVDSALRRRFHFVPFFPDEPPIKGLLERWLKANKPELHWLTDVVDRANELVGNRHFAIGPSFFLRKDLDESWIHLIWKHSVLPYLEEQFVGEEQRLQDFSLDKLRASSNPSMHEPETPDAGNQSS